MSEYRCIVVDPPWDQGKTGLRRGHESQGTDLDYKTMRLAEIAGMAVPEHAADNAWMWLWVTNSRSRSSGRPIIQQGFDLMKWWGFRYYIMITWDKGNGVCPFGPYQITTEHVLFGYRGKANWPKDSLGKMQTCLRTAPPKRHSEKPAEFYEQIARLFPGPRLDVFARRRHEGFDAWGDEVEHALG